MTRKQNPEQSVADVIAESGPPTRTRSFGTAAFHILGRIAADPALRYTASGKAVLDLTLATTTGGVTAFHTVILWERTAEVVAQYGGKGRELYVEGRIGTRTREIDGHRIRQADLVVESFQLLGRRLAVAGEPGEESAEESATEGAA